MIYHAATATIVTSFAKALEALDIPLAQDKRTPAQQRTAMCLLRGCKEGAKEVVAMNWNTDTHIIFRPAKKTWASRSRSGLVQVAEYFGLCFEQVDMLDPTSIQWATVDYSLNTDVLNEKLAAALLSGEDHE